jgi:hypothetical protein
MKLQLTTDGTAAVVRNGLLVVVDDSGAETEVNVAEMFTKLKSANSEAKTYRLELKEANAKLSAYGGVTPEDALNAVNVIKNLDTKKLLDAGEVEKGKSAMAASFNKTIEEQAQKLKSQEQHIYKLEVSNRFEASEFLKKCTTFPTADMAEAYLGKHFKVEDGQVVGYDHTGAPILSKSDPTKNASFEEALSVLIDTHPNAAKLKVGNEFSGGGSAAKINGKPVTETTPKSSLELIKSGLDSLNAG